MQRSIPGIFAFILILLTSAGKAQEPVTSVDPELLNLQSQRVPKEYIIRSVRISGVTNLDTTIVKSISGLREGQRIYYPGGDEFAKAINNLWRQRFFSNVQIYIIAISGEYMDIEINVQERPKLASFRFVGPKRSEADELKDKVTLARQTIITENTRRNAREAIEKYYREKGYLNVSIRIEETPDPVLPNSNILTFYVEKGRKVRVADISFFGNEAVTDMQLKKQMKGTREMMRFTLHPEDISSPYGENEKLSFSEYMRDWGFLSLSRTRDLLDPYFRFRPFSSAKFDPVKYAEDKEKLIDYYNSLGFRDAQIIDDNRYVDSTTGKIHIDLLVSEGSRYYFGDIAWKGNTKYSDSLLNALLGIRKGDIYNVEILNRRLGKQLSPDGADISALYMDDGYLFFRVEPVETAVYNDTIDYEIRVFEGPQARIGNVTISGNEKTKDYVVRRELRTLPGELFSRSDLIRSQRELAVLSYFNQEKIAPNIIPHQETGTVDINWSLEEKSSDQLELSAGWGGGIGLTGTLGVTFNNFSIKNILKREAWDPLPQGDGQKLSLRYQSNGRAFSSYNFSFTEPWLGGVKRNSLTVGVYHSKFSNAYDISTGRFDRAKSDTNFLKITGASVSLGKQLKWPDDFFSFIVALNYTQYQLRNYRGVFRLDNGTDLDNAKSDNISIKLALQRSSINNPTFPSSGSNFVASVQLTPPYSLLNEGIVNSNNPYKNPEYHKWRFNAEWFVPVGRPLGAENNRQFVLKLAAKYGFMGRYNSRLAFSPFERFQVGGDGLTNNMGLLGYDIISLRGYPVFENPDPSVNNPDQTNASRFFTIFNKYSLELRYPIVTNPASTIYALTFFDAANGWYNFDSYNPFQLRRSAGVGMRFFLPMFGLLGFDYGIGLDRFKPGQTGLKNAARFTFMLGFEPE